MKNRHGFTLIEIILASAIGALVMVGAAMFLQKLIPWIQQSQTRNQMNTDGRIALETITHFMQPGLAGSVATCACAADVCAPGCAAEVANPPTVPANSRIEYDLSGSLPGATTTYYIYWANRQVLWQMVTPALGPSAPKVLASNVSRIRFNGDSSDPTLVHVGLWLDNQASGVFQRHQTFTLPDQVVRLQSQ